MARRYSQAATDFLKDVDGVGGFSTDADALLDAQAAWFATNSLGDVTDPVIGLTFAQTTFDALSRPGAQKQLLLLTDTAVRPGPGLQLADKLKDDDNWKRDLLNHVSMNTLHRALSGPMSRRFQIKRQPSELCLAATSSEGELQQACLREAHKIFSGRLCHRLPVASTQIWASASSS